MTEEEIQKWEKGFEKSIHGYGYRDMEYASPLEVKKFVDYIRFLQMLIHDLKQDNTGYQRGVEDGKNEERKSERDRSQDRVVEEFDDFEAEYGDHLSIQSLHILQARIIEAVNDCGV